MNNYNYFIFSPVLSNWYQISRFICNNSELQLDCSSYNLIDLIANFSISSESKLTDLSIGKIYIFILFWIQLAIQLANRLIVISMHLLFLTYWTDDLPSNSFQ